MLTKIARFEIRYLLRNPLLWLTAAFTFGLFFFSISSGDFHLGSGGVLLENAAYATLRNYLMLSVLFMFVTTSFVANAVHRDDETGFGPIIHTTPITKRDYVMGRYLGAFAVAAGCMLLLPAAIVLGSWMPWADPAKLGPNRLTDHLYAYFLLALPNLFVHSAVLFALATLTRSMMATYLGVIGFFTLFGVIGETFAERPELVTSIAMADPFGGRALTDAVRYWTVAERNALLPEFGGTLLWNRLMWVGIALVSLVVAYVAYGKQRRTGHAARLDVPFGDAPQLHALPSPQYGGAASRALLWMRTRFEMKQVVLSPAFPLLLVWGLVTTFFALGTQRDPEGRPRYPTTLLMIPGIEEAFMVIPLIIAVYYAGELVWRERDRRAHELIDASPIPNWAYVVPKTLAMALVLVSALLTNVVASIILQLLSGYTQFELSKYLLWYVLPESWDMLLIAAVAVLVQALSPHKAVGWGVMLLFLLGQQSKTFIQHNLLLYGGAPAVPISDMNGAGSFWIGAWTFRLYWGAFAVLLLLAAHLLWRRGVDIRLRPRLAHARRRLTRAPGLVAVAALAVFAATGAYAYYNTNVLNVWRMNDDADARAARLEKKYWKYHGLPQPVIAQMTLNVALEPEERRAVTKGRYVLRNVTSKPIEDVHLRLVGDGLELTGAAVGGARLILDDREFAYRIYRLDAPMQPGQERVLTFETRLWHRGFRNKDQDTAVVEKATFLRYADVAPIIGMSLDGLLWDPDERPKYGLSAAIQRPKVEDLSATKKVTFGREWTRSDITVSTTARQTPIAPGRKVSDLVRGGRRIARFVSDTPIRPEFSIQSARYAEKHRRHAGVDLAVYYHAAHPWNVDRMLNALAAALDYCQTNFGPYPFGHARIVEFPGYSNGATAFAGTIPYSETYGFISKADEPNSIDHVTGTTAHELAHQYWAHQITGADMEGQTVLNETLAQYTAMMVVKRLLGEDHIRRHLQFELDEYLRGRAWGAEGEPPLARVEWQSWVCYHKGSLAMYLLQKRMGEEAVNRALRNLLQRYKFKGPPYPRSLDFVELLRAEARTEEERALITDLFERIALYDLKVTAPTVVRRPDGKWDVTVPVEAKKLYADAKGVETETPLDERIEVGLFTAEPGLDVFDEKDVVLMERRPIRSGRQVLRFVTDRKPSFAGVDPYHFYIDRRSSDNVVAVR